MRYTVLLCTLVVGTACAASGAASTASAPTIVRPATQTISGGSLGSLTMSTGSIGDAVHVPYSADAVWRIMPSIFDSIGIPVTEINQANKTIGNRAFKTRTRLGKVPMSKFLDCGTAQIGASADSYDIVLSVLSNVVPDGVAGASVISTIVEAQARPAAFNQAYSSCSSKGTIESKLAELVKARLSR
ncbi:MAG: hypothetical protein ABJB74_15510 [Gemmatimonas sp.]